MQAIDAAPAALGVGAAKLMITRRTRGKESRVGSLEDYIARVVRGLAREKSVKDIAASVKNGGYQSKDKRLNHAIGKALADNTVRRRRGIAKQFLRAAVRRELVQRNPFADLVAAVRTNTERMYFVTREESDKVLDGCPDAEWRLLFALSRFGGL